MSRSRVLFTTTPREIERLDIATGPCVPLPTRKRPLVGVHSQFYDTPEQMSALFGVLGGDPRDAWSELGRKDDGLLVRLGDSFVDALAALSRRAIAFPKDDPDMLREIKEIAVRWLGATRWPRDQLSGGLEARLVVDSAWARIARERSQHVYCWFGPAVPEYVIVTGTADTLDEYLAAKRRRRR